MITPIPGESKGRTLPYHFALHIINVIIATNGSLFKLPNNLTGDLET